MTKNDINRVIPIAPLDRLIRKANAERVSESAAKELGVILEQLGKEIADRAIDLAKHANRATVNLFPFFYTSIFIFSLSARFLSGSPLVHQNAYVWKR